MERNEQSEPQHIEHIEHIENQGNKPYSFDQTKNLNLSKREDILIEKEKPKFIPGLSETIVSQKESDEIQKYINRTWRVITPVGKIVIR